MGDRRLRKRCRALLRELDARPPLDVRELCARLARQRGRPIRLVDHPIKVPGPFGLWFMTESMDVIFYQRLTSRPHQDHIILHEIGHIIADHPSDEGDDQAGEVLTPDERPGGGTRALRRTCYDSAYEREAELIATVILEWASVLNPLYPAGAERLGASLSHHQGWLQWRPSCSPPSPRHCGSACSTRSSSCGARRRTCRRDRQRGEPARHRVRRGLIILSVAVCAFLIADATKSVLALLQATIEPAPGAVRVFTLVYLTGVAVGAARVRGRRQLRGGCRHARLGAAVAGAPALLPPAGAAVDRGGSSVPAARAGPGAGRLVARRLGWDSSHYRFDRRVVEIRDGLVLLGPYFEGAASGADDDRDEAHWAAVIRGALRAKLAESPIVDADPALVPGGDDLESDARRLAAISQELAVR